MKKFILSLALSALFVMPDVFATTTQMMQQEPEKIEIKHTKLPEKTRMNITEMHHGAEILKAYKEVLDGKIVGYTVEVQKGPKKWTVLYDENGAPKNKVQPE